MWRGKLLIVGMAASASFCVASVTRAANPISGMREPQFSIAAVRHSGRDNTLPQRAGCEASQPPQALATPDPMTPPPRSVAKVAVSFIIGVDGRVHSPIILESAGPTEDHDILGAILAWRYRPALCNAIPIETESKVEFSSH